MSIKGKV